jgi:hypothetical protein
MVSLRNGGQIEMAKGSWIESRKSRGMELGLVVSDPPFPADDEFSTCLKSARLVIHRSVRVEGPRTERRERTGEKRTVERDTWELVYS